MGANIGVAEFCGAHFIRERLRDYFFIDQVVLEFIDALLKGYKTLFRAEAFIGHFHSHDKREGLTEYFGAFVGI